MPSFLIPYSYSFTFCPEGLIKDRSQPFAAEVKVDVRQMSADQAPLAGRIANTSETSRISIASRVTPIDGRPRELRHVKDEFYVEWGSIAELRETIADLSGRRYKTPFTADMVAWPDRIWTLPEVYKSYGWRMRRTSDDDRERVADRFRQRAAEMFILDGRVFEKVAEPVIVLDKGYRDDGVLRLAGFTPSRDHSRVTPPIEDGVLACGRLDELEEIKARLATAGITFKVACEVEVLRPEWFYRCPEGPAILDQAHDAARALLTTFSSLPASVTGAAFELRDAINANSEQVTPALIEALRTVASIEEIDADYEEAIERYKKERNHEQDRYTFQGRFSDGCKVRLQVETARQAAVTAVALADAASPQRLFGLSDRLPMIEIGSRILRPVGDVEELRDCAVEAGLDPADVLARRDQSNFVVATQTYWGHAYGSGVKMIGLAEIDHDGGLVAHWPIGKREIDDEDLLGTQLKRDFEEHASTFAPALNAPAMGM